MNEVYAVKYLVLVMLSSVVSFSAAAKTWVIENEAQWLQARKKHKNFSIEPDKLTLTDGSGYFKSVVKRYPTKRTAISITFKQGVGWHNWQPSEDIGPVNLENAPVFLSKGNNNYWLFGLYGDADKRDNFKAEKVVLDGLETPLLTTPFANQYDAPGGLNKSLNGYHAWQSTDMKTWIHHGPVTNKISRWVTSAEYIDGKTYIFYDYPNDQDPHLYIDGDLTDGKLGDNQGRIFKDPSDGSDTAFFHDTDGSLHVIYEDWTPINAQLHAWDSPLAGHAVSYTGYDNFEIKLPVVDLRTTPTGKVKTYTHPYWQQHPDWDTNIAKYQEHLPIQDAFGDWAMIKVGKQYYLFGDYDHSEHSAGNGQPRKQAQANMSIARFTSCSLDKQFDLVGDYGKTGHPDPAVGFANGKFYLITQTKDFVSDGPWVDTVTARVGVDVDNDGEIDLWTDWQKVKETYQQNLQFSKHIEVTPATIDLSLLPAGYGFSFEIRANKTDKGISPDLTSVSLVFSSVTNTKLE
jgi:hypothetical protein